MTAERTAALGGERTVPTPDPIAREYLILALRIGQRIDGLIDGYFGPADLKAQVDTEQLRRPERLVADAVALQQRVAEDVPAADRRDWLRRQLVALETHARSLGGERLPYREELGRLFDWAPARRDEAQFANAAARLDVLLPGANPLVDRLAAWDAGLVLPEAVLADVVAWLVARFREQARATFGLPDGESFRTAFVRNRPWSGYNWYEGGLRSRFDLNLDLPVRAPALIHVVAHETYPGHHLEHAWKEADLVERQGRLEASVLLINAPECVISEGLADLGHRFAVAPADEQALLAELLQRAGVSALAGDDAASIADRALRLAAARSALDEIAINAALMRHADGVEHDTVLEYLVTVGRMDPARAAKRLEFIEHPLWRSYVFVYDEGEALLAQWVDGVPEPERAARFGRLLHEQLTPSAIAAEIVSARSAAEPDPHRSPTSTVSGRPTTR
jgi:hypothetical protein